MYGLYGLTRRRRVPAGAALLLLALATAPPARANTAATIFGNDYLLSSGNPCPSSSNCWSAGYFGILVGEKQTFNFDADTANSSSPVSGAIGVAGATNATSGALQDYGSSGHNETWSGPIDFADSSAATSSDDPKCPTGDTCKVAAGTAATNLSKVTLNGPSTLGDANASAWSLDQPGVMTALSEVSDLATFWKGVAATNTLSGNKISASTTITARSTYTVYDLSSISLSSGQKLTIDGTSGELVVVNISGNVSFASGSSIVLSGGILPDDVLFNITSTDATISLSGALEGDFFYDESSISTLAATLDGRLLSYYTGSTAGTTTVASTFDEVAPADIVPVPEPRESLLLAGGLAFLAFLKLRR